MHTETLRVEKHRDRVFLQDYLADALGLSRRKAKELIDSRNVFVNRQRVWMARHVLRAGDAVEFHGAPDAPRSAPADFRTIFEDDDLLVIEKPPGLLSNGPDSAETILRAARENDALRAVHRLDRDTTGCNLFSKTPRAHRLLVDAFKAHRVSKVYHAIALGKVPPSRREIELPIDGERALTRLQVLDANARASHLKLNIETGRTHQIRMHLRHIRHPILGDKVYAPNVQEDEWMRQVPRQMLHARTVIFPHPATGEVLRLTTQLPADFRACLRTLRLR